MAASKKAAAAKVAPAQVIEGTVGVDVVAGDAETAQAMADAGVKDGDVIAIDASDAVTEPPPADAARFAVEPRCIDHVVVVDIRRGGELIGALSAPQSLGINAFYTAMHETKGDLAEILRKVHDDAFAAGVASVTS